LVFVFVVKKGDGIIVVRADAEGVVKLDKVRNSNNSMTMEDIGHLTVDQGRW